MLPKYNTEQPTSERAGEMPGLGLGASFWDDEDGNGYWGQGGGNRSI